MTAVVAPLSHFNCLGILYPYSIEKLFHYHSTTPSYLYGLLSTTSELISWIFSLIGPFRFRSVSSAVSRSLILAFSPSMSSAIVYISTGANCEFTDVWFQLKGLLTFFTFMKIFFRNKMAPVSCFLRSTSLTGEYFSRGAPLRVILYCSLIGWVLFARIFRSMMRSFIPYAKFATSFIVWSFGYLDNQEL